MTHSGTSICVQSRAVGKTTSPDFSACSPLCPLTLAWLYKERTDTDPIRGSERSPTGSICISISIHKVLSLKLHLISMLLVCKLIPLNQGTGVFSRLVASSFSFPWLKFSSRDILWGPLPFSSPTPPTPRTVTKQSSHAVPTASPLLKACSPAPLPFFQDSTSLLFHLMLFLLTSPYWVCEHWLHTAQH